MTYYWLYENKQRTILHLTCNVLPRNKIHSRHEQYFNGEDDTGLEECWANPKDFFEILATIDMAAPELITITYDELDYDVATCEWASEWVDDWLTRLGLNAEVELIV